MYNIKKQLFKSNNKLFKRLLNYHITNNNHKNNVYDELYNRNLISNSTEAKQLYSYLSDNNRCIYLGIDPTTSYLHVGHLLTLQMLSHFQNYGHKIICLLGGATALIGDPSGRIDERQLLSYDNVLNHTNYIKNDINHILNNNSIIINNYEWYNQMNILDFLRDVGKHFRMSSMLNKESVRSRLSNDNGMSFTEFTYQCLQSYDFYHLYQKYNCTIQIGGSDQWGNITAGIDYIKKQTNKAVYGITSPLLTTSDGKKLGKSTNNASIYLNSNKTTPYQFYQYFYQTNDQDVIKFLKMFTHIDLNEIKEIEYEHLKLPEKHLAQEILAYTVTKMLHGQENADNVKAASIALFSASSYHNINGKLLLDAFQHVPSCKLDKENVINHNIIEIAAKSGVCKSKSQARKLIKSGGLYLNNIKITDENYIIQKNDIIDHLLCIIRTGKKNNVMIQLV